MKTPNKFTIIEAHNALKNKEVTCKELVKSCLDQIKKHDDKVKAFITVCEESALKEAELVDQKIQRGEEIGLLEGIPYSVKDAIMTEDVKTTAGSKMLDPFIAPFDATVIRKLREAGAIIVGKTNCDAYGHGSSTENSDYFVTKNPWDTERVAGGSSGGSAASVAMHMCIFSIGEDTGGSIRQPASLCGISGLKTSYGRVSRYGGIAYASSLDTIGPFAKNIEDIGIIMECIAGNDEQDHSTATQEVPDYNAEIQTAKKLKIGLPKEYFTEDLDPEINKVIMQAVEKFKELGHEVKEISLPMTEYCNSTYYLIATSETSTNLARLDGVRFGHRSKDYSSMEELFVNSRSEGFGAEAKRRIMIGTYALSAGYADAYYKKAQKVRTLIIEDYKKAHEEVDLILSPTSPFTAFKIGEKADNPMEMYLADIYTVGFSLAGLPTISIPCGFYNALPVGMQLTGRYLEEVTVLQAANEYQSNTDHHTKEPLILAS